jgi:hypothetical protein
VPLGSNAGTRDEEDVMPRVSFTAPWECVLDGCRDLGAAKLDPEIASHSAAEIVTTRHFVIVIFAELPPNIAAASRETFPT